jgi:hypothetical protein
LDTNNTYGPSDFNAQSDGKLHGVLMKKMVGLGFGVFFVLSIGEAVVLLQEN